MLEITRHWSRWEDKKKIAMKAHGEPDSDKREERKQKMDLKGKRGEKRGWARDVTTRNK